MMIGLPDSIGYNREKTIAVLIYQPFLRIINACESNMPSAQAEVDRQYSTRKETSPNAQKTPHSNLTHKT
jgi:hypothetical protein